MSHYVCIGECGGSSEEAGTCSMESCSKHAQQLQACECTDGTHNRASTESDGGE